MDETPLQRIWADLPDGTPIECHYYTWPEDDALCDYYPESEGPRSLRVYQTREGKILLCEDFGAYCQGDSEYGQVSYYDTNGDLVLREGGFNPYLEMRYTLFDHGRFVSQHILPAEDGGYQVMEIDSFTIKAHTSEKVTELVTDFKLTLKQRHEALLALLPTLSGDKEMEAKALIAEIGPLLNGLPQITNFVLRKADQREAEAQEMVQIAGEDVNIYALPSLKAEVVHMISYFNCCVPLVEMGPHIPVPKGPLDQWVKVSYWYSGMDESAEGWILSSNLMRGFFPE